MAFRVKDKREMVEKMCNTMFGNAWQVRTGPSAKSEKMLDWLRKHNKELDELFSEKK